MMRESLIEQKVCALAGRKGWLVHPKAAAGRRGWPDRLFTKVLPRLELEPHPFFGPFETTLEAPFPLIRFVEFKAPGQKPTPLQMRVHQELKAQGYEVYVIDSLEAGKDIFR